MQKVTLNGKEVPMSNQMDLESFLFANNYKEKYIAVAVNKLSVPRSLLNTHLLKDGDKIEVLSPMAGG